MIKEQQNKICQVCAHYSSCGFVSRDLQYKCPTIDKYDDGYDMGYEDAVDKVKEKLLQEVLPNFMHGGEADEVIAMLEEILEEV